MSDRVGRLLLLFAAGAAALTARPADAQFCFPGFPCGGGYVSVSVETDRAEYVVGDPITYSVVATNPSSFPVTLNFNSSRQADYLVDGVYSPNDLALQVLTSRTVPAHGSVSWGFRHPWDDYELAPGTHGVIGEVVGNGHSAPVEFNVAAPDPVAEDVFLDFETYPDGTPTHFDDQLNGGLWDLAFVRAGVRFSSDGGGVALRSTGDSAQLFSPRASYPPGFNIVAEFDMPVFGVSADVGSAADQTVTMTALDAAGAVLGVVTSDPVTDYPSSAGRVSFDSSTPIASVRWTSSLAQAAVTVDDLFLNVSRSELMGDFNGDGLTDAADYALWRDSQGQLVPVGSGADADHNGLVDGADFDLWRANYGQADGSVAVPEPSTFAAMAAAAAVMLIAARQR